MSGVTLLAPALVLALAGRTCDHQHDFDFEFGAWRADVHILQHPFSGTYSYIDLKGTSVVYRIWNGRANYGELIVGDAKTHIEGLTLRLYDPKSCAWHVYFANAADGQLGVPTAGRFENGEGVFYDTEPIDGKLTRVRYVFSDITPRSFRFVQSFSRDAGKTWEADWISTFTR